jgi:site-specific recombinase XerD
MEGAVVLYLERLRLLGRSPNTQRTTRLVLGRLSRWHGGPILYMTGEQLHAWHVDVSRHLEPASIRNAMSCIRGFFTWAQREGLVTVDPCERLDMPRAPRRLPRPMPDDEVRKALSLTVDPSVRAILALARFAGLRACEIATLDWSEVQLSGREPLVRVVGKGNKERVVDVSPELAEVLLRLPSRHGPVIPRPDGHPGHCGAYRISQLANDYLREIGLGCQPVPGKSRRRGGYTLHTLRHSFGTAMVDETGDLAVTAEAMGHESMSTTKGYAKVSRRNVRAAVMAAGRLRDSA